MRREEAVSTYKPLTDEELDNLSQYGESLRAKGSPYSITNQSQVLSILEQARRANKLAEAAKQLSDANLRDFGDGPDDCDCPRCGLLDALRSYLGELAPAEGGGRHDV